MDVDTALEQLDTVLTTFDEQRCIDAIDRCQKTLKALIDVLTAVSESGE